jgi:hypothetical protein
LGSNDKVEVTIGETNVGAATSAASATRHTIEAKKLLKHPLYSSTTYDNNIALIYLPVNAVKSANVAIGYTPMQDPSDTAVFNAYFYNNNVKMVGWGQTAQGGTLSSTLQYAQALMITRSSCLSTYSDATTNHICTKQISTSNMQVIVPCFI